jgi:HK97 gp10 family phage protein
MADTTIRVSGLREAQKALYSYSQQLGDFVVYKALRAGANIVRDAAREKAPEGETGKLKRGIVVMKSRINNGRKSPLLGVTVTIRKGKGDPFYGRFQEDGWNTHGKRMGSRARIVAAFGSRTGRKTQPGKTNVPGKKFIDQAFIEKRAEAVDMIVRTSTAAADLLASKVGL